MQNSSKLENGDFFRPSSFAPVEIEALATYKNIIATGEQKINHLGTKNSYSPYQTNSNQIIY